jgi:hypothetical protein
VGCSNTDCEDAAKKRKPVNLNVNSGPPRRSDRVATRAVVSMAEFVDDVDAGNEGTSKEEDYDPAAYSETESEAEEPRGTGPWRVAREVT